MGAMILVCNSSESNAGDCPRGRFRALETIECELDKSEKKRVEQVLLEAGARLARAAAYVEDIANRCPTATAAVSVEDVVNRCPTVTPFIEIKR